jgi:large subunit ribosomal protein L15
LKEEIMANELSSLQPVPGSRRKRYRVGRGYASGNGKTAGRGTKGQGARGTVHPSFEGGQMPLYRRLPKRGFTNVFASEFTEVRLDLIASRFQAGDVVDADSLAARGLVSSIAKDGIKVLGNGDIGVALTVRASRFTKAAAEKIRAAGGTAEEV